MSFVTDMILPKDYGYVMIAAAGTFIVGIWHGARVTAYRRKAGVKYPKHYGDSGDLAAAGSEAKKDAINLFNCAQRAHGNFLENYPIALTALLLAGLQFPRTAAAMGLGWSVSRVLFAVGYTNPRKPDGSGRYVGITFWIFQLGLIGMTAWTGVKMVL